MTDKQQRFIEEYMVDYNGAAAARRAGYSPDRARIEASELLKDEEVSKELAERFKALTISAEEAAKHLSDIATTRLNEFIVIKQVQGREQAEQYVTVILENTRDEIEIIKQFIIDKQLDEDQKKSFNAQVLRLEEKCLEYELDIARYGNDVTRLAYGRPVVLEVAELDLVALARAKEKGRIKSFQHTEHGIKVELYGADGALGKILEYHGKLVQKHEHSGEIGVKPITGMTIL